MTNVGWLVRAVSPDDDLDALLAGTIAWPGADQMRSLFSAPGGGANRQFVAVLDDRLVGYAHCITFPLAEGGRAGVHVWVGPATHGRGIGSARGLAPSMLPGRPRSRAPISSPTPTTSGAWRSRLATGPPWARRWESRLELAALSLPVVETAVGRATAGGVQLPIQIRKQIDPPPQTNADRPRECW